MPGGLGAATVAINPMLTDSSTPVVVGTVSLNGLEVHLGTTVRVVGTGFDHTYVATVNTGMGTWSAQVSDVMPVGIYEVSVKTTTLISLFQGTFYDASSQELRVVAPTLGVSVTSLRTTDASPRLVGALSPAGVTASVRVTVNGKQYTDNAPTADSWTVVVPQADALAIGTWDVTAIGFDSSGRMTPPDGTSGELDVVGGAATVAVDALDTTDLNPTLTGTFTDVPGVVASIRVSVGGDVRTIISPTPPSWSTPIGPLVAGVYDVQVEALDAADNVVAVDATSGELVIGNDVIIDLQQPKGTIIVSEIDPPSSAQPVTIATQVDVSAGSLTDFDGFTFTAAFETGSDPMDEIAIFGEGDLVISGSTILYLGTVIGQWTPGVGDGFAGRSLIIDLNDDADTVVMTHLIEHLTWVNRGGTLTDGTRTLALTLTDGSLLGVARRYYHIVAVNNRPVVAVLGDLLTAQNLAVKGHVAASDADSTDLTYTVDGSATPNRGAIDFSGSNAVTTAATPVLFTYRPLPDASGDDSFRLLVSDGTTAVPVPAESGVGATVKVRITPFDDPSPSEARPKVVSDPPYQIQDGDVLAHAIRIDPTSVTDPSMITFALAGDVPSGMSLVADPANVAGPMVTILWTADASVSTVHAFGLRVVNTDNQTMTWLPITLVIIPLPSGGI